jgi:hypothetical protein
LSGDENEVARIARVLGETPERPGSGESALYLIAPNGDLLALFAASQPTETVTADLIALSDRPLETYSARPDE